MGYVTPTVTVAATDGMSYFGEGRFAGTRIFGFNVILDNSLICRVWSAAVFHLRAVFLSETTNETPGGAETTE